MQSRPFISLDFFASLFVVSTLTLLFLPEWLLLPWQGGCASILLLGFSKVFSRIKIWLKLTALILCFLTYAHYPAISLSQQADQIATLPNKVETNFIIDAIQIQQSYQAFIVRAKLAPELPEQKIYVQWKLSERPQLGEHWHGELRLRPISSRLNFNGFDRQSWYLAKGITAWASVNRAVRFDKDFSLRAEMLQRAYQQTSGLSQQGLLLALGFGERAWLPNNVWQIYQQTNTAHLIAISGLHIGLAMMFGFGFARALQFCFPTTWITPTFPITIGLCLAVIYAYFAGFAIPTLRAILALLIIYAIQWQRLYWNRWRLFLRIIALLLLIDPLMILSTSFWLSVGAVGCLLVWYQFFPLSLLYWRGKQLNQTFWHKWRYPIGLFHLQLGLLWLFTPIQLFFFNGISANSLIANLIAVPTYSLLLVPLVLFAIITQGALSSWDMANWLAEQVNRLIAFWQQNWLPVSINQTLIITLCFTLLFLWILNRFYRPPQEENVSDLILQLKRQPRGFHFVMTKPLDPKVKSSANLIGTILCIYCLCHLMVRQNQPSWQLDALDVGQGLAHLIVKDGYGILYDTGPSWKTNGGQGSMAKLEIIPYLQREGIVLDNLILSHDDNDHAGGAPDILTAYPNVHFLSSSTIQYGEETFKNFSKTHRAFCKIGLKWKWRGLKFEALAPKEITERADNPHSCVLRVSDGQFSILLTGDADQFSESQFLSNLPKTDVLQVGHHGSKTSTSQALLYQMQPKIALISAGRWNPWHFPHFSVTERLQRQKVIIKNTAFDGQIRLSFYSSEIKVETARNQFSPWYRQVFGLIQK